MLSQVLQSKPRGRVRRELYRQGLGVGELICGLHRGPVATQVFLRLAVLLRLVLGGMTQNFTVFFKIIQVLRVFFFTDGVMNYSRSLVLVGLTNKGSKNILSSHIFTPFPPTARSVLVPVQSRSNLQTSQELVCFFPGRSSYTSVYRVSLCIFAFLCNNSGGQRVSTTAASGFVRLHGHSNKTSRLHV